MAKVILFVDGENFIHKIEDVFKNRPEKKNQIDIAASKFSELFEKTLEEFNISRKIFYAAKLHVHPETKTKSETLIRQQRKLRNALIQQKFEFTMAGNVRAQMFHIDGKTKVVFKEKGVDVKIAVDLVSLCCDKKIDTAILCSSDSDLQPAITEIKRRGVKVVYLGFEISPNKGLTFTCNKTILFRNSEILKHCPPKK